MEARDSDSSSFLPVSPIPQSLLGQRFPYWGTHSSTHRQTLHSHMNTSLEALLPLPSGNAVPAELNLGTHLHKRLGSTNFHTGIMSLHLFYVSLLVRQRRIFKLRRKI